MNKLKLYLETTVFNYYFDIDREFHEDTLFLFDAIANGIFDTYTSEYVTIELQKASDPKKSMMLDLIDKYNIKMLNFDSECTRLANLYVREGVIPERFRFDASHIAIASTYGLDCVVSFNFQHINKLKTKSLFKISIAAVFWSNLCSAASKIFVLRQ